MGIVVDSEPNNATQWQRSGSRYIRMKCSEGAWELLLIQSQLMPRSGNGAVAGGERDALASSVTPGWYQPPIAPWKGAGTKVKSSAPCRGAEFVSHPPV